MSESMERAVRHRQKNRNSGRLKSVVASELEEEVVKKNAWEKEVSDLEKHQTAAAAATADANRKLRKLIDNRASAESFLERTAGQLEKYGKRVADATEAEEDIDERKRRADGDLEESEKKIAKLTKELAGIDEANRKKVIKRNLVEAMHDTAMVEEWELDDIVKATPLRFMDWYKEHGYKISWSGDDEGPVFPTDGTVGVLNRHLDKILERDWKIDFGTLCDHCRNEILTIMEEMGFRVQGFKNGKYTAISALAPAEDDSGAAAGSV